MYSLPAMLITGVCVIVTAAAVLAILYVVVPLAYRARMRRRHAAE